ncbi:MAG: response regulator transcription factor [Lachnospiraceae bacterium]|nr:response regulator transcription factor [Lachnospiraceae bacterium]
MYNIMIIDDDLYINKMLEEALVQAGYSVTKAFSGKEALEIVSKVRPDLVLLDLMLPGLSGEGLLPHLRGIPVIVVSAKIDVKNKVELLLGGAADYVTKPFDMDELLARITVQLRKPQTTDSGNDDFVCVEGVKLNTALLQVNVEGTEVALTRTECAILKILMVNAGRPVGRSTILDRISLDTPDCTERSLKQHISNIRKKLQAVDETDHIETIYGIGFKYIS